VNGPDSTSGKTSALGMGGRRCEFKASADQISPTLPAACHRYKLRKPKSWTLLTCDTRLGAVHKESPHKIAKN